MSFGQQRSWGGSQARRGAPREQRDNDGAVWVNREKQSPKHPDFRGSATVAGRPYWVALWVKPDQKNGGEFFSLSFTPKDEQRTQEVQRPAPQAGHAQAAQAPQYYAPQAPQQRPQGFTQQAPIQPQRQAPAQPQQGNYNAPPDPNWQPPSGPEDYAAEAGYLDPANKPPF